MKKTIHRALTRERFVTVDQSLVDDYRLSWAARGLLTYLLSLPDDWNVHVSNLVKQGDLGRDGIHKLMRELRETGYVHLQRRRGADGQIRGSSYLVFETPCTALPDTVEPGTAGPDTAKPAALPNTHKNKTPITTTTPTDTYTSIKNRSALHMPGGLTDAERAAALNLIADLDDTSAQIVLDEWGGALVAGVIHTSPIGYLKTLAMRYCSGDMTCATPGHVARKSRRRTTSTV